MHNSAKQTIISRPEQQLLSCGPEESLGMLAATLNGNELLTDYSSVNEHLKQRPRKTYR